jgi:hypothetical protein
VFPLRKVLSCGHSTPDEALAPLRSSLPWIYDLTGDIKSSEARLEYNYAKGRGSLHFNVQITIKYKDNGYAVISTINRLDAHEIIQYILGLIIALSFVVYKHNTYILLIFVCICIGIRIKYVFNKADLLMRQISMAYPIERPV